MKKFIKGFIKDQMYKSVVTVQYGLHYRSNDLYMVVLCCNKENFFYYRRRSEPAMSGMLRKAKPYNLTKEQLLELVFFCEELIEKSNR